MADGILTPAVSVTSAVGGIAVAKANVANDITPISIVSLSSSVFSHFEAYIMTTRRSLLLSS